MCRAQISEGSIQEGRDLEAKASARSEREGSKSCVRETGGPPLLEEARLVSAGIRQGGQNNSLLAEVTKSASAPNNRAHFFARVVLPHEMDG